MTLCAWRCACEAEQQCDMSILIFQKKNIALKPYFAYLCPFLTPPTITVLQVT